MPTPGLVRFRQIVGRQRDATSRAMVAAWDALPSYDESDLTRYAAQVQPLLDGAKAATVASSSAFYAYVLGITPPPVKAADVPTSAPVGDPFHAMWRSLATKAAKREAAIAAALEEGEEVPEFDLDADYEEARSTGRSVADATGRSFIESTARLAGDALVLAAGLTGVRWQRVAEPGSCPWCAELDGNVHLSAADGDYGHDRCGCNVVPFTD